MSLSIVIVSSSSIIDLLPLLLIFLLRNRLVESRRSPGIFSSSSSFPCIMMWYVCTYFPVGSSYSSRYQYMVCDCYTSSLPSSFFSSSICMPSISRFNSCECFMALGPPNWSSDDFDSFTRFFIIVLLSDLNSLLRFTFFRSFSAYFISLRPAMIPAILGIVN